MLKAFKPIYDEIIGDGMPVEYRPCAGAACPTIVS